ncbi:cysteine hydrolase family protein [Saccharibacillus alkalitolerans]|uniref:Cysteine hydrolase n=1 Tax=Saccharibacillus alkalitolerans TaxID=2705290 RepID=A0ABX0F7Z2_9BACL|nr:isochorismatase family cysteine hydrolase [Saccharibacillus alkalitolerans]NGZ76967.1 cysteine hydrolase [Saccharibacillus alkalitolerans]
MKIAFLIIDMQTVHLGGVPQPKIDGVCEYINYVSRVMREAGHPVIHIQDIEGMTEETREHYRTIGEVATDASDLFVTKEYSNAFWKTELEDVLKGQEIERLILAGFAAEHCVQFTYNGAIERGFGPVLLQNGILSRHDDAVAAAYRDRNLISYPAAEWLANA